MRTGAPVLAPRLWHLERGWPWFRIAEEKISDAAISLIDAAFEAAIATVQGRPAMMPNFDKDFEAGRRLLSDNGLPVFEAPIHLEGGSIHSDGQGTMVVTEECLLDPSRNPDLGREGIEQVRGAAHVFRTPFGCADLSLISCISCLSYF